MRPANDSDVIRLDNGANRVSIRSTRSGFLPSELLDEVETNVAEALHEYLQHSSYTWAKCCADHNQKVLTETLDNYLDMIKEQHEDKVRYVHVEQRMAIKNTTPFWRSATDAITKGAAETADQRVMQWALSIHLEEASAPCIIKIEMTRLPDENPVS